MRDEKQPPAFRGVIPNGIEFYASKFAGVVDVIEKVDDVPKPIPHRTNAVKFIDKYRDADGGGYHLIQGQSIRGNNSILRVIFLHAVIDVKNSDALTLSDIVDAERYPRFEVGKTYEGVEIYDIQFHTPDSPPPLPTGH